MRSELRLGRSRRRVGLYVFAPVVMVAAAAVSRGAAPKFRPDDPIQIDDDRTIDAKGARPIEGSNAYDFAEHTFLKPGEHRDVRAMNVNTVDDVPDSSWFTNRIGVRDLPLDELVRWIDSLDKL